MATIQALTALCVNIGKLWMSDLFKKHYLCTTMSHIVKYNRVVNLPLLECCKSLISSQLYSYCHNPGQSRAELSNLGRYYYRKIATTPPPNSLNYIE